MAVIAHYVLNDVPANRTYDIKLETYGSYRVTYSTVDDAENTAGTPVIFNVTDKEKAVIVLSRNNITTAKKGTTVVLAPFTAVDNHTDSALMVTCCFVIPPDGIIRTINMKDCNSFVASVAGTYVLRYMAKDEAGNITIENHTLVVTE